MFEQLVLVESASSFFRIVNPKPTDCISNSKGAFDAQNAIILTEPAEFFMMKLEAFLVDELVIKYDWVNDDSLMIYWWFIDELLMIK